MCKLFFGRLWPQRKACLLALVVLSVCLPSQAQPASGAEKVLAQDRFTVVAPFPPGGPVDTLARMLADGLQKRYNQPAVVENLAGAAGNLGIDKVKRAKPDGHTLLLSSTQHAIAPLLMKSLSYDYLTSLQAITTLSFTSLYLVVPAKSPAEDLNQLIVLLKKSGGHMNFASSGGGSLPHLSGELLNLNLNVKVQHIPFQGTSPATNAV